MFTLSTVFIRSVNLFRGQEVRAKSPHTSVWGRLRLAGKSPALETLVMENLKREIAAGSVSTAVLVKLVITMPYESSAEILKRMAIDHIVSDPANHAEAVRAAIRYLNDQTHHQKCIIRTDFPQISEEHYFFPRISYAQGLLRGIMKKSTDASLKQTIKETLDKAPSDKVPSEYFERWR